MSQRRNGNALSSESSAFLELSGSPESSGPAAQNLHDALQEWRAELGDENVLTDSASLREYSSDLSIKSIAPPAVILPGDVAELQKSLLIANRYRISLHAISRGRNWAYGSACPVQRETVVCSLSRLNRILEVNTELAYAVVEPGVTQQQLFDYLEQHNIPLSMDVTGASPDSSLLGNLTERGYGQTPYGDRFQHSSGLEVLLADGTLLRTGFGHFENPKSYHLYKWGLGPYLDGIFTQSNFGIVTKAGIWLMPKPKEIALLILTFNSDAQVANVFPKLRDLKLRGLLPSTVHVSNEMRIVSCFQQYPFDRLDGCEPIDERSREELLKKWGLTRWTCFTSLRGSKAEIRVAFREIKRTLRKSCGIYFADSRRVKAAKMLGSIFRIFTGVDPSRLEMLYHLVSGRPSHGPTYGTYWRKRTAPSTMPPDPIKDKCGLAWIGPIVPCVRSEITSFLLTVKQCTSAFGFESNLTLTMLSERALCGTIGIFFDKENEEESGRARACYLSCLTECVKLGYIPYRHGINAEDAADTLFRKDDPFWATCRKLKEALDPNHVLSPGKYGIA